LPSPSVNLKPHLNELSSCVDYTFATV